MGPVVGALLLCGAEYGGHIRFNPDNAHEHSEPHASLIMQGSGQWQAWTRGWPSFLTSLPSPIEEYAVVAIQCGHPCPPYIATTNPGEGMRLLVTAIQVLKAIDDNNGGRLLILAFDSDGCHLGKSPSCSATEALTWLRNTMASTVPTGHPRS